MEQIVDSVYIHIPFCENICTYCDFCKMLFNEKLSEKYLDALNREINDKYLKEVIKTIYIGGGSPSVLPNKLLKRLFEIVKIINLSKDYEFTFECNVNEISTDLLNILKDGGVNRLSIGIESFNKDNLALMDRYVTFEDAKRKIALCRSYGFNNINLDIIYALPNEEFKTLKKDLSLILKLNPEHISTYSLILEDNTLLKIKGYESVSEDLDFKMYDYIIKKLKSSGYNHYEISNFSKKGYESKHNLNCWNNNEYYGFGLGAAGYFSGVRYQNTKSLTKYLNDDWIFDKEIVSKDFKMKYELMLGLRKIEGVNIQKFYQRYEENIQDVFNLNEVMKNKDLLLKNNYLLVNPKKLYVMNEILIKII